jgi:hypothetical protein
MLYGENTDIAEAQGGSTTGFDNELSQGRYINNGLKIGATKNKTCVLGGGTKFDENRGSAVKAYAFHHNRLGQGFLVIHWGHGVI